MAVLNIVTNMFPKVLAIINDTANTLAVINDNKSTSENLNYVIGGLFIIVVILIGNMLFSKK